MKTSSLTNLFLLSSLIVLTSCASLKEQEVDRQNETKTSLSKVIELVKQGNLKLAESTFYENANCGRSQGAGCYEYLYKGEAKVFRASDSHGFDSLVNHIQVVAACGSSKNVKDLESCVRRQKDGIYVRFILPQVNSYNEETEFDVKRFCEIGLGGMTPNPNHNNLFRAVGWNDFSSVDENICEVL